jgi:B9 domain-containing protein 2
MHLQVWHYDQFGRQELYAYGCCFVPISPGEHEVILIQFLINNHHQVQCHTWRPIGGVRDEMTQSFVGGGQQLRSLESLSNPIDRMRLRTIAMGRVTIRLAIVVRHFDRYGIVC